MTRYATTTDLTRLGLPSGALTNVPTATQEEALDAFSSKADGYLRTLGYTLPLTAWGDDLRLCVAHLVAYDLMVTRGFSPGAGNDQNLRLRHEDALAWLHDVARGTVTPDLTDSTPSVSEETEQTCCVTNARRNWTRGR